MAYALFPGIISVLLAMILMYTMFSHFLNSRIPFSRYGSINIDGLWNDLAQGLLLRSMIHLVVKVLVVTKSMFSTFEDSIFHYPFSSIFIMDTSMVERSRFNVLEATNCRVSSLALRRTISLPPL